MNKKETSEVTVKTFEESFDQSDLNKKMCQIIHLSSSSNNSFNIKNKS